MKKLTLKDAQAILRREVGTAAGLEKSGAPWGMFEMVTHGIRAVVSLNPKTGKVELSISLGHGDGSSLVIFDRETLEPDYDAMNERWRADREEALAEWVGGHGPEICCRKVKEAWMKL